ncbi:MAG: type II toxin-antitoxin system VapC family toxin [Pyrinomonadaceae bacterium]
MYILDTCILDALFHSNNSAQQTTLRNRLEGVDDNDVWVSVVTVYEILIVGIVSALSRRLNTPQAPLAFDALIQCLEDISDYQILPYTDEDDRYFRALPANVKRQGPLDCRIASSAVSHDFLVITNNTDDFEGTGARCEDWTIALPA